MRESPILHASLLALSEAGHLAWRNNTAMGWAGKCARLPNGDMLIRNPYPIHAGLCVGSGDIIICTKEGRFAAVETKSTDGRQRIDQKKFGAAVIAHGGIYGVARSAEDSLAIMEGI